MELQLTSPKIMQAVIVTVIILATSLVLGLSLGTIIYYKSYLEQDKIYKGIYFNDIDISGLTQKDVRQLVKASTQKLLNKPVYLVHDNKVWDINPREINMQVNADRIIKESYEIGRQGTNFLGFSEAIETAFNTKRFVLSVSYDHKILQQKIASIAKETDILPVEAKIIRINDAIVVSQDRIGHELSLTETQKSVIEALRSPKTDDRKVRIVVKTIYPELTTREAKSMDVTIKIASYSTRFRQSVIGRSMNIKLGANLLNGTIVKPGELFSFNKVVGPRTVERGFKQAPEIVNSKLVPGIGGGICQVSSTLYNAILLSDIKIVERHTHSHPLTYVPLGYDSTVSYGSLDFRFRNTLSYPIAIFTKVSNGTITVDIYGHKKPDAIIKIFASDIAKLPFTTITKTDKTKNKKYKMVEQNGITGYRLKIWKAKFSSGKELSREIISLVRYRPISQIVIVGSKDVHGVSKTKVVQQKLKPKTNLAVKKPVVNHPSTVANSNTKNAETVNQQNTPPKQTEPKVEENSPVDSGLNNEPTNQENSTVNSNPAAE